MKAVAELEVSKDARVHVTDYGPVSRIDLNMLGAELGAEPAGGWGEWERAQNRRLCDFMAAGMTKHGGSFDSIAEWTVAVNARYDLQDMRNVRTARFGGNFRSAITTLPWGNPASAKSVSIQTVGYVQKDKGAHFAQKAWQPDCLYDCSFLGLSPAVVVETGPVKLIYLSGVVAWDKAIKPLAGDDPRAQVRIVLQKIQEVFVEAGGTPADVVRLRPFTASKLVAQMVREECDRLWTGQGYPAPTLLVAEESSFWDAPSLYTEIQVMGIVGGAGCRIGQEECTIRGITRETTRIRRTTTPLWDMFHVSDLRASAVTGSEDEAVAVGLQVTRTMKELNLAPDDVSLAVVYASSAQVMDRLSASLRAQINPYALHLVHCPPMAELNGGTVKVELTARKLKQANAGMAAISSLLPKPGVAR
jgi:enamine deaminase RidA (YjgF/YER057c/UK114 family)